jgi:polyhydroxybutyrate depolymerase
MHGSPREIRTRESVLLLGLGALLLAACSDFRPDAKEPAAGSSSGGADMLAGGSSSGGSAAEAGSTARGGSSPTTAGAAGTGDAGGGGGMSGAATSGSAGVSATGGAGPSSGCTVASGPKSGRASIDVGGTTREYIVKVPDDYDSKHPYKLIFAFHARGGNATQVAGTANDDYYGLFSRAQGKAIFVSPEGLDAGWRNEQGRDIAFVKAMLEELSSKLCIDRQRIFSAGFSFGGMMSDAIGCAMADVFRAIAPMSGGIPNADHPYSGCDQVNMHPVAVWMSHGDADTVVPIADGKAALDIFVARSHCQAQTSPVAPSPCVAYQGCMPEYPIHFCQFSGGHNPPSFAADGIWTFFAQF